MRSTATIELPKGIENHITSLRTTLKRRDYPTMKYTHVFFIPSRQGQKL